MTRPRTRQLPNRWLCASSQRPRQFNLRVSFTQQDGETTARIFRRSVYEMKVTFSGIEGRAAVWNAVARWRPISLLARKQQRLKQRHRYE